MLLKWHASHRDCPRRRKSSQPKRCIWPCVFTPSSLNCDVHGSWLRKSRRPARPHSLRHLPRAVRWRAKGCVGLMRVWPGVRSFMKSLRWVLDWGETTVIHNPVTLMTVGCSTFSLEHISLRGEGVGWLHWGDYNHVNQFLFTESFLACLWTAASVFILICGAV